MNNKTKAIKVTLKKLVRDKVIKLFEKDIKNPKSGCLAYDITILKNNKNTTKIKKKLLEEIKEAKNSFNKFPNFLIEIADLLEALETMKEMYNISTKMIEKFNKNNYNNKYYYFDSRGYTHIIQDSKKDQFDKEKILESTDDKFYAIIINYIKYLSSKLLHSSKYNEIKHNIIQINFFLLLLLENLNISFNLILSHKYTKKEKKGGFEGRYFLHSKVLSKDHPMYTYYLKQQIYPYAYITQEEITKEPFNTYVNKEIKI